MMLRSSHIHEPLGEGHWNLTNHDSDNLSFEVNDKENRPGFTTFHISKGEDGKIACVLSINGKSKLDTIESGLCQAVVNHCGFFQSFALPRTIQKVAFGNIFILKTEDYKMAEMMAYYVDSKLQFNRPHYEAIERVVRSNTAPTPGWSCTLV